MSEPTILTARLCGPEFEKRLDFLMRQMAHTCWTEEMAVAIRALHAQVATLTDERDALSKQVDALLGAEVREADAARGKG